MAFEILTSQLSVEATTTITFLLTILLTFIITKRYFAKKTRSLAFWSAGLWMFAIGMLLEIIFAIGIYSESLIAAYLFVVATLVELLALGSMQLVKNKAMKNIYYLFVMLSTLFLLYFLATENIGNILTDHIVYGNLPLYVAIASSMITFPAAAILIIVAAKGYFARRSNKLLSIITGVIIISAAGTLYIAQYPAFLYVAEFVGILALWYGFV